jgi:excisionase family DNA binding protein
LVQPFPAPGQLAALAYRELERAANGSPEQIRTLGDARLLPRSWEPASCSTPQLRQQLWFEEVVEWLVAEYAAERLGIGRTVMYALVGSGAVESVQIGRLRRVPADALVTLGCSSSQLGRRRTAQRKN